MHVDLSNWLRTTISTTRQDGLGGLLWATYHGYLGGWISLSSRYPIGKNIYERDWDLLIVLDACRVDALREVAPEYDFLGPVESMRSVGSTSSEWVLNTFTSNHRREIGETTYVTSNFFAHRVLSEGMRAPMEDQSIDQPVPLCSSKWDVVTESDLANLDKVWTYVDSDEGGGFPPRPVTDRSIQLARTAQTDKMIVHYMQPHAPYIGEGVSAELKDETQAMIRFRKGEFSREQIWEAYLANLRHVLNEVELLLKNVDADSVAITADHGEALGEFGAYSHPFGWLHPAVKRVPWVETQSTDAETYQPALNPSEKHQTDIEQRLEDLGYV